MNFNEIKEFPFSADEVNQNRVKFLRQTLEDYYKGLHEEDKKASSGVLASQLLTYIKQLQRHPEHINTQKISFLEQKIQANINLDKNLVLGINNLPQDKDGEYEVYDSQMFNAVAKLLNCLYEGMAIYQKNKVDKNLVINLKEYISFFESAQQSIEENLPIRKDLQFKKIFLRVARSAVELKEELGESCKEDLKFLEEYIQKIQ